MLKEIQRSWDWVSGPLGTEDTKNSPQKKCSALETSAMQRETGIQSPHQESPGMKSLQKARLRRRLHHLGRDEEETVGKGCWFSRGWTIEETEDKLPNPRLSAQDLDYTLRTLMLRVPLNSCSPKAETAKNET